MFRVTGDMIHNFACVFVVAKTISQRSCEGLSWHTACLYMAVFGERVQQKTHCRNSAAKAGRRSHALTRLRSWIWVCGRVLDRLAGVAVCRYLDLITMWFIELPEGVSIWDFVSV